MRNRRPAIPAGSQIINSASVPVSLFPVADFDTISSNLNCVAYWGTVLRNHSYTGPALTVEDDSNPGTTIDIYFNAFGFITEPLPYGDDTRVVALYDQFGSSNLFATLSEGITIRVDDFSYGTWAIVFTGNGALESTDVTGGGVAWELPTPFWASSFIRQNGTQVTQHWGINASSGLLTVGVRQVSALLNWRVAGSASADWANTDFNTTQDTIDNVLDRAVADYTSGTAAEAYYNGTPADTLLYTGPIVYDAGEKIVIGGGGIVEFNGTFFELGIFSHTASPTAADIAAISESLLEVEFFAPADRTVAGEHSMHYILGNKQDSLSVKGSLAHAILGHRPDSLHTKQSTAHVLLGNVPDHITTREQTVHVIIVP